MGFESAKNASVVSNGTGKPGWRTLRPRVAVPSHLNAIAESPQSVTQPTQTRRATGASQTAWAISNGTTALKSARTNVGSRQPSQANQTIAAAQGQHAKMSINKPLNPSISVWNPSLGPTPSKVSMMSMAVWKARVYAPSRVGSNVSVRKPFYNTACRASNCTKRDFKKGQIIAIPFHTANTNPNVDPTTDDQLAMTVQGPVYSKRRMVIIMWIHERDMFCLPLYTFNAQGLRNKGPDIKHEYVSVKNAGKPHVNQGLYPAVEVVPQGKDMHPDSTVHITGGLRVGCNEDITWAGRITKQGYAELLALWRTLSNDALKQPWLE